MSIRAVRGYQKNLLVYRRRRRRAPGRRKTKPCGPGGAAHPLISKWELDKAVICGRTLELLQNHGAPATLSSVREAERETKQRAGV